MGLSIHHPLYLSLCVYVRVRVRVCVCVHVCDGLAEPRAVENVADGPVGRLSHLLQVELCVRAFACRERCGWSRWETFTSSSG